MNVAQDRDITAILPQYTENGDGTVIVDAEGHEKTYPVGHKTILTHIADRQCKDLRLLRKWTREYTGQQFWIPLGFSWELVLMPIPVREAKIKGDATVGYVNFVNIESIQKTNKTGMVIMENGIKIPTTWGIGTVQKHIKDAMLVHSMLLRNIDENIWLRLHKTAVLNSTCQKIRSFKPFSKICPIIPIISNVLSGYCMKLLQ